MYLCKNLGQEGEGAKYLIHIYLGRCFMAVVLQNWS